jgi:hypothetical protein
MGLTLLLACILLLSIGAFAVRKPSRFKLPPHSPVTLRIGRIRTHAGAGRSPTALKPPR